MCRRYELVGEDDLLTLRSGAGLRSALPNVIPLLGPIQRWFVQARVGASEDFGLAQLALSREIAV
jgi:hypothetical protein